MKSCSIIFTLLIVASILSVSLGGPKGKQNHNKGGSIETPEEVEKLVQAFMCASGGSSGSTCANLPEKYKQMSKEKLERKLKKIITKCIIGKIAETTCHTIELPENLHKEILEKIMPKLNKKCARREKKLKPCQLKINF